MPQLTVHGITIDFPLEPYACQVDYMAKVIECLQNGANGILESPTGTGKTLCLLCATMAWLEHKKAQIELEVIKTRHMIETRPAGAFDDQLTTQLAKATGGWDGNVAPPKILYSSRTHSQLSQAMQELKRTTYSSKKASVLGSRDQLCIHPHVRKEQNVSTKVHMCRAKVNARTCNFYNNVDIMKHNFTQGIVDVEDLVKLGEKHKCCPYYTARELKNDAEIIFMPYNYLLDPKSRKAHQIDLQNNIVIFDEAHNLEKICEDSVSFDLTSYDLATAIEELRSLGETLAKLARDEIMADEAAIQVESSSALPDFSLQHVMELKSQLINLEAKIDELELPPSGLTKPGSFVFELLSQVDIKFETKNKTIDLLEKMITHLTNESASGLMRKGVGISKLLEVLKIVFSVDPHERVTLHQHTMALSRSYKVHVGAEQSAKSRKDQKQLDPWAKAGKSDKLGRTLSYWCFSPGLCMKDIRSHGVKSIILTSGTLSPIDSFTKEMGIDFSVRLENPHIIDKNQFMVAVVPKGPDMKPLNSSYHNRGTDTYKQSLGNSVVNFARTVPNGLLMFFPSYPVMTDCIQSWERVNIYNRITEYKPIFQEPKSKVEFQQTMDLFYERVNDEKGNGAIFAAVCRGKASEGLDFADNNGRAVVITGLPFPPRMDPKVILKMAFLDENIRDGNTNGLSGNLWYKQQASRAVNQAIGRVIRHKEDYGAILLCDERFVSRDSRSQLPSWVRPYVQVHDNFGSVMKNLTMFYKNLGGLVVAGKKSNVPKTVQSASFPPSETRPSVTPAASGATGPTGASLRSTDLPIHVPGLRIKKTPDGEALARLRIEYERLAPTRKLAAMTDLLGALDTHSQSFSQSSDDVTLIESPQTTKYNDLAKRMAERNAQKSKVVLKKTEGAKVRSGQVKVGSDSSNRRPSITYTIRVKSSLDKDAYRRFSQATKEYLADNDYNKMVAVMTQLFMEDVRKHDLFTDFIDFVKPQHKADYRSLCSRITGETCSMTLSVPTSNHADKDGARVGQVSHGLKRKSDADLCGKLKKDRQTAITVGADVPCSTSAPSAHSSVPPLGDKPNKSEDHFDPDGTISRRPKPPERKLVLCEGSAEQTTMDESNIENVGIGSKDVIPESVSPSIRSSTCELQVASLSRPEHKQTGYTCCSCCEDARVPLQSQLCQHVCCFPCWKVLLAADGTKKCPECGIKVKRKALVQIHFPSGPNLPINAKRPDGR